MKGQYECYAAPKHDDYRYVPAENLQFCTLFIVFYVYGYKLM